MYAIVRLEAAKDDYRIHCEELEKQLVELQHRNDELTCLAEESRALKDELDILRFILLQYYFFFSKKQHDLMRWDLMRFVLMCV